jgi:hypothetical protein
VKYHEHNVYLLNQKDVDRIFRLIEYLGGTLQELLSIRCHNLDVEPKEGPYEACYEECMASVEADVDDANARNIPY